MVTFEIRKIVLFLFVFLTLTFNKILAQSYLLNHKICTTPNTYTPHKWMSNSKWYFGEGNIGNFAGGTGAMTITAPFGNKPSYEGVATASDDGGNLLFFTNGVYVWNNAGTLVYGNIATQTGLMAAQGGTGGKSSAARGVLVVRHPLDTMRYYIFTGDDALQPAASPIGLYYSVHNRNGTIISGPTKITATPRTTEAITATRHANGVDIWIAVHKSGTNELQSYLLTCNGLTTTPVTSAVSFTPPVNNGMERGSMQFSWDGNRLASSSMNATQKGEALMIYDFNKTTGVFSNPKKIASLWTGFSWTNTPDTYYDVEFSPDNNRIYGSLSNGDIWTFNLVAGTGSEADIHNSRLQVGNGSGFGCIELGGDGNLYHSQSTFKMLTGNINTAVGLTYVNAPTKVENMQLNLPNQYIPPADEPIIQAAGPFCVDAAPYNLSTLWTCLGTDAENPTGVPSPASVYSGPGITDAANGVFNPATAGVGTHTIIFTRCNVDDTIQIVVNPLPTVSLANQSRCSTGPAVTFDAGAGHSTYAWSGLGSGTGQTTTGSNAGTYTVTVTNIFGCVKSASATLTVNNCCPDTSLSSIPTICSSGSTVNLDTYKITVEAGSWSIVSAPMGSTANISGGNTLNINNTVAGSYVIRFTLAAPIGGGCPDYSERTVIINAPPTISVHPTPSTTQCPTTTFNLSVTASPLTGLTYQWKKNGVDIGSATTASLSISNISATDVATYTVVVTNTCGTLTSNNATLALSVVTAITTQPQNQTLCVGGPINLSVVAQGAGTVTYQWLKNGTSLGATAQSDTYSIPVSLIGDAGSYHVEINSLCGPATSNTAVVTVNPLPTVNAASPAAICSNTATNIALTSTPIGASFNWTSAGTPTGHSSSSGSTIAQSLTSTSTANVTYTVNAVLNGCSSSVATSIVQTVNPIPAVNAVSSTAICSGATTSISLTSSPVGGSFFWTSAGTPTGHASGTGTSIAQTLTATTTANVTYSANAVLNGCTSSVATAIVQQVNALPVLSVGPQVCVSGTINITPNSGGTWLSSNTTFVTVTNAGVLTGVAIGSATVTFQDAATLCSSTSNTVNVVSNPVLGGATQVCMGSTASLTPASGGTWVSGNTAIATISNSGVINPVSVGSTTFTYTISGSSCSTTTGSIPVYPIPVVDPLSPNSICSGSTTNITFTSSTVGAAFSWTSAGSPSGHSSGNGATIAQVLTSTASNSVTYSVTAVANLCTSSVVNIVQSVLPIPSVNAVSPAAICSGSTTNISLTSTPTGASFGWVSAGTPTGHSNNIGSTIAQTLTNATLSAANVTYTVGAVLNGCSSSVATVITQTVNPIPSITSASSGGVCSGSALNYDIVPDITGTTFNWSRASVSGISNAAVSNQTSDPITETLNNTSNAVVAVTYSITPTVNSCSGTPFNYVVQVGLAPVVTSSATATVCSGTALSKDLVSNIGSATFTWDRASVTGISNPAVSAQTSDPITEILNNTTTSPINVTYVVTAVEGTVSCPSVPQNLIVTVNPTYLASDNVVATDDTVCSGGIVTYTVNNISADNYTWTYPAGATISYSGSKNEIVTITYGTTGGTVAAQPTQACASGITPLNTSVVVIPAPTASAGDDVMLSKFETVSLSGSGSNSALYTYSWTSDGATSILNNPSSLISSIDVKDLTVTNTLTINAKGVSNCSASDEMKITVEASLFIPSAFSPNGDGDHETFDIVGIDYFPDATVEIYNQWGEIIYKQNGGYYTNPWNGKRFNSGDEMPMGGYFYVVFPKGTASDKNKMTGYISLLK